MGRETHSRLFRPWFTFSASARALAPPSPVLLLENLQETDAAEPTSWSVRVEPGLEARAQHLCHLKMACAVCSVSESC